VAQGELRRSNSRRHSWTPLSDAGEQLRQPQQPQQQQSQPEQTPPGSGRCSRQPSKGMRRRAASLTEVEGSGATAEAVAAAAAFANVSGNKLHILGEASAAAATASAALGHLPQPTLVAASGNLPQPTPSAASGSLPPSSGPQSGGGAPASVSSPRRSPRSEQAQRGALAMSAATYLPGSGGPVTGRQPSLTRAGSRPRLPESVIEPLGSREVGALHAGVPHVSGGSRQEPFPPPLSSPQRSATRQRQEQDQEHELQQQESSPLDPRRCSGSTQGAREQPVAAPAPIMLPAEENAYLKKNVDHLRSVKHKLEGHVQDLTARLRGLEQRKNQYKLLYEQAQLDATCRGSGEMEISNLHQQLNAVSMLKDALNSENLELQRRVDEAERAKEGPRQAACVICLDNLANVVCLPCKHLALCAYCGQQEEVTDCPICRASVEEKMQIYTP